MIEKKPDQYPQPLEAVSVIIMIIFGIMMVAMILNYIFPGNGTENLNPLAARLVYVFGGMLYLIIPYAYAKARGFHIKKLFRFNAVPAATILISVAYGLALMVIGDEVDRLIELLKPYPEWLDKLLLPLYAESVLDWLLIIIGVVLITSVCEEALFRGFFQVTLEKRGDVTKAVILSAAMWTIFHFNIYWAVQILITGIFIGYIAWRTNSIIPAIIVHAINNFLAVLSINAGKDYKIEWYEWQGHVAPWVLIVAIVVLFWAISQLNIIHRRR